MSRLLLLDDIYATVSNVGGGNLTGGVVHYSGGSIVDQVSFTYDAFTFPGGGVIVGNYLYVAAVVGLLKFHKDDLSDYELVSGSPDVFTGVTYCNGLLYDGSLLSFDGYYGQTLASLGDIIYFTGPALPVVARWNQRTSTYLSPFSTTYGSFYTAAVTVAPSGNLYVLTGDGSVTFYVEQLDAVSGAVLNVATVATVDTGLTLYGIAVSPDESFAYITWVNPPHSGGSECNEIVTVPLPGGGLDTFATVPFELGDYTGLINSYFPLKTPIRQYPRDDHLALGAPRIAGLGPGQPSSTQNSARVGFRGTYS